VISHDQRRQIADALEAANVRHDVVEYPGVGHGFLNDRRDTFDAAAAEDAWARIRALFADELRDSRPGTQRRDEGDGFQLWIRRHDEYGAPDDAEEVAADIGAGL
jgi:Dienelactone hydrolase family